MLADMMADYGGRLLVAIAGVGLALFGLAAALKIMRQKNGTSPFSLGVKTRTQRLQVIDAAAIDTRRRLVLVRRDDVEHLILVGGPSDVVVESNIPTGEANLAPGLRLPAAFEPVPPPRAQPLRPPEPERAPPPPAPFHAEEAPPPYRSAAELRPAPQPLERPLPVTPHAAYFEADDDLPPQPAPARPVRLSKEEEERAAALKAAEEHLEALKRRMMEHDPSAAKRKEPERPSGGFGQVLEQEMKAPLRDTPRPVPAAIQQMPRRDAPAAAAPKPQASAEANLQDEIARIFGDKR